MMIIVIFFTLRLSQLPYSLPPPPQKKKKKKKKKHLLVTFLPHDQLMYSFPFYITVI